MTTRQSSELTTGGLLAAADEALVEAGFRTGEFGEALRLAEAAARRATAAGDRAGEAAAAVILGFVLHYRSITTLMDGAVADPAEVAAEQEQFGRALTLYEELGDEVGIARAAFGIGVCEQVLNRDWTSAMVSYRRAESLIPALEVAGDLYTRSEIHRHLGFYHLVAEPQPAIAAEHLRISLDLREQQAEPRRIPSGLVALGWAEREAGNTAEAVRLLRRAVDLATEAGLLPARIADAETELREAEAALAAHRAEA
jgi:tetratricopeptide (TPR) repeat protein